MDGFLPPGGLRPARTIRIPNGFNIEARNATGRWAGRQEGRDPQAVRPWWELELIPLACHFYEWWWKDTVPSLVREPVAQTGQSEKH